MIGERLQELRREKGFSQADLAEKLNISFHTISSYERNRSTPDDEVKVKIAKLFDVSVDYLLGLVKEPYSYQRSAYCIYLPKSFQEAEKKQVEKFIDFLKYTQNHDL